MTTRRQIQRLRITARRPSAVGYATAADLDLAPDGRMPAADETALIHAADFVRERALYTLHTPEGLAAALASPFLYSAAIDHATGVLSAPFERLGEVHATAVAAGQPQPCFIFSPGRAGSTLLVQLLRAVGCHAASEPDWFTHICQLPDDTRHTHICQLPDDTRHLIGPAMESALVLAGVNSLAAALGPRPFIKLRSQCNDRPEALAIAGARAVLLLRGRRAWSASRRRAFGEPPEFIAEVLCRALAVADRLAARGMPPLVLWYEDLVADPAAMLRTLVPGVRLETARIDAIMRQDAQAGTGVARSRLAPHAPDPPFEAAFDRAWKVRRPPAAGCPARAILELLERQG